MAVSRDQGTYKALITVLEIAITEFSTRIETTASTTLSTSTTSTTATETETETETAATMEVSELDRVKSALETVRHTGRLEGLVFS